MKVLQITHGYYQTKVYQKLFEKLAPQLDYCVAIPVDRSSERTDFEIGPVRYCNIPGVENRRFGLLKNARRCMALIEKKIDLREIDLIHAHFLTDAAIARLIRKKYGIPYVTSVRISCCEGFIRSRKVYRRIIARQVLRQAAGVVFIAPATRQAALQALPNGLSCACAAKSAVIPNGIDDFWHANACHGRQLARGKTIRVITVASLIRRKNQIAVARAIASLREAGYDLEYVLYGDAQDEAQLAELTAYDFVRYEGVRPKEQLIEAYREADIFALVSHRETFGLVYAEALSQALPVIWSRGEGFDGQLPEGTGGVSAAPEDIEEIKHAITQVIEHYEALSAGCAEAAKRFDWARSAAQYRAMYKRVMENKT